MVFSFFILNSSFLNMGDPTSDLRPPTSELYPGHAAELARKAARDAEIAAAAATPLPGPLARAFDPVPAAPAVAGLTVRPVVHYDFVILDKLESPLLAQLRGREPGEQPVAVSDQQGYEIIFQFTRPVRAAAAVLAQGRSEFSAQARETIGMELNPGQIHALMQNVQREFSRAFCTVVGHESPPPEGEVFTTPPAPPMTASAGGSITSAGWFTRIRNSLASLCSTISQALRVGSGSPGQPKTNPGPTSNAAQTATSRNIA